jgi:hypothetical protein
MRGRKIDAGTKLDRRPKALDAPLASAGQETSLRGQKPPRR